MELIERPVADITPLSIEFNKLNCSFPRQFIFHLFGFSHSLVLPSLLCPLMLISMPFNHASRVGARANETDKQKISERGNDGWREDRHERRER